MFMTDLADAARSSGLPVIEEPGWQTRGHGAMSGIRSIICHHTAGAPTGDTPSLQVVMFGRADLAGPLCNLYLSRSGTVYVVAAGCAWHAGAVFVPTTQGNDWAIGIEAEATGVDPWPPAQYAAYTQLCAALCRHYSLTFDRVLGHKEVASPLGRKTDPNFPMDAFRAAVSNILTGGTDMTSPDPNEALLVQQLVQGPDPATGWGWDAWPGGSVNATTGKPDRFTVVDYLRKANQRDEDIVKLLNTVLAKVNTPTATTGAPAPAPVVDLDALAAKVADVLSQRLAS